MFCQFISNHFELENLIPNRRFFLSALFFICFLGIKGCFDALKHVTNLTFLGKKANPRVNKG